MSDFRSRPRTTTHEAKGREIRQKTTIVSGCHWMAPVKPPIQDNWNSLARGAFVYPVFILRLGCGKPWWAKDKTHPRNLNCGHAWGLAAPCAVDRQVTALVYDD